MNSKISSSSEPPPAAVDPNPKPARGGLFNNLKVVFIAGIILATLFTGWTEPGLLPSSLADRFNSALQPAESGIEGVYPTPTSRNLEHIGIVAGHSGNDSGAVCPDALGGIREVDVNLDVAERVRSSLEREGFQVDLLTEFDPLLRNYRALVLVSIHADSCQYINDQATGYKVAAAMSTTYPERALRLTNCLRTRYANATGLSFHAGSVTDDMTNYHSFEEINSNTPAAIIETGFLNLDRDFLTQQPDLAAKGISDGILCYLRNEDIPTQTAP
jgi:N-acetylmuramoyl-L-alanine amidase